MKLDHELYQLSVPFDIKQLQPDLAQITDRDWSPQPIEAAGNSAMILAAQLTTTDNSFHCRSEVPTQSPPVPIESYQFKVLTPQKMSELTAILSADLKQAALPAQRLTEVESLLLDFNQHWAATFAKFGQDNRGELAYQDLILRFNEQMVATINQWLSPTGKQAVEVISTMLLTAPPPAKRFNRQILAKQLKQKAKQQSDSLDSGQNFQCPLFEKPIFIVSAPRAGSTLLFETLSQFKGVWSIAEESHEVMEGIAELHPAAKNFSSNRLTEEDALPAIATTLRERFAKQLHDRDGLWYVDKLKRTAPENLPIKVRFLEKTPKNALRIPFLKAVFPEALFIYLYREPKENINSLMEGWRLRRFVAYRPLPGWPYQEWSFLLPPGWETLQNSPLVEIAAYQWKMANTYILDDLQKLPRSSWCLVPYSELIREPKRVLNHLGEFAELEWDAHVEQRVSTSLPVSRFTLSAPSPDKWRKHEKEIMGVLPGLEEVIQLKTKFLQET